MVFYNLGILLLLIQNYIVPIGCLTCFSCQSTDDSLTCNKTVTCSSGQVCFLNVNGGIYNLGCTDSQLCSSPGGAGIVGRSIWTRQSSSCHECCSTDGCNSDLCKHQKPTVCMDDETVDCAKLESLFHVCKDTHQASLVCPKFCHLCTLVDGNWAEWSSWSSCDVTCGNGVQTKLRTCTNPAPANGGFDCVGNAAETKVCQQNTCPVPGEWSLWSSWGSCSASCDVGMQRRDRTCSNPYPSLNGDHCFGESRDDRLCMPGPCADGAWSSWGSWESCSASCGGGVKSRLRTCTSPKPSLLGRYCDGSPLQLVSCNQVNCPDGAWSSWGSWESCSASCGGGVKSRLRTCTSPKPSLLGRYCDGSPLQVVSCNQVNCPDGAWSSWGSWESCSASCGGGVKSRLRTCTSPKPSLLGRYCDGSPLQVVSCNQVNCPDGVWSSWGSWESCSASCGVGVKSRLRTCTSPKPSLLGRYCDGSALQVVSCNQVNCPAREVAFTAHGVHVGNSNLIFPNIDQNYGNGYDNSTGIFTCPVAGIYHFVSTLTKTYNSFVDQVRCYLYINSVQKVGTGEDPVTSADAGRFSMTISGTFHLNTSDVVNIAGCLYAQSLQNNNWCSFTGFLVTPDN